jgi:hypothetical protein
VAYTGTHNGLVVVARFMEFVGAGPAGGLAFEGAHGRADQVR